MTRSALLTVLLLRSDSIQGIYEDFICNSLNRNLGVRTLWFSPSDKVFRTACYYGVGTFLLGREYVAQSEERKL